ncbi:ligand-binding sensor domain-containing protein [Ideonella paludis]|uniref:hypothetical protein n=1 Tax=Ideonella paludis TaxID=1233411 RepID=UPI0036442C55
MASHHFRHCRIASPSAWGTALKAACISLWLAGGLCALPARATSATASDAAAVVIERINPTRVFSGEGTPKGLDIRAIATDAWSRTWVGTAYGIWIFDGSDFYFHKPPLPADKLLRAPDVDWMRADERYIYHPWGAGRVIRTHQHTGVSEVATPEGWRPAADVEPSEDLAHRTIWCEQAEGVWSVPQYSNKTVRWTELKNGRQTDYAFPTEVSFRLAVGCADNTLALLVNGGRVTVARKNASDQLDLVTTLSLPGLGIDDAGRFHFLKNFALLDGETALAVGSNGLFRIDLVNEKATVIEAHRLKVKRIAGFSIQNKSSPSERKIWVYSDSPMVYKLDERQWRFETINLATPPDQRKVDFAHQVMLGKGEYIWSGAMEELALTSLGTKQIKHFRVDTESRQSEYASHTVVCLDRKNQGWYTNLTHQVFAFDAIKDDGNKVNKVSDLSARTPFCDWQTGVWVSESDKYITHYWKDERQQLHRRHYPLPEALAGRTQIALADEKLIWLTVWNSIWTLDIQSGAFRKIHEFEGEIIRMADGDSRAEVRLLVNTREGIHSGRVVGITAGGQVLELPQSPEPIRQFRYRPGGDWVAITSKGAFYSLSTQPSLATQWQQEYVPMALTPSFDRCVQIAEDGTLWFMSSRALWSWRKGQAAPDAFPLTKWGPSAARVSPPARCRPGAICFSPTPKVGSNWTRRSMACPLQCKRPGSPPGLPARRLGPLSSTRHHCWSCPRTIPCCACACTCPERWTVPACNGGFGWWDWTKTGAPATHRRDRALRPGGAQLSPRSPGQPRCAHLVRLGRDWVSNHSALVSHHLGPEYRPAAVGPLCGLALPRVSAVAASPCG